MLVANNVRAPTIRRSRADAPVARILKWNNDPAKRAEGEADGIVMTASDTRRRTALQYNPPTGPTDSTPRTIANRANELTADGCREVNQAKPSGIETYDLLVQRRRGPRGHHRLRRDPETGIRIGADPLGGGSATDRAANRESYPIDLDGGLNDVSTPPGGS